jgi:hypothetical protein
MAYRRGRHQRERKSRFRLNGAGDKRTDTPLYTTSGKPGN